MTDEQRAREDAADLVKTYGADLALLEGATAAAIFAAMQQARREERGKFATADCHVGDFIDDLDTTEREDG